MRTITKDVRGFPIPQTITAKYGDVDNLFESSYFEYKKFNVSCLIYAIEGAEYEFDGVQNLLKRLSSVFMIKLLGNTPVECLPTDESVLRTIVAFHAAREYRGNVFADGIPYVCFMENFQTLDLRLKKEYFSAKAMKDLTEIHNRSSYVMTNVEDTSLLTDVVGALSGQGSTTDTDTQTTTVTYFHHRIIFDMSLPELGIHICPEWIERAALSSKYFDGIATNFKQITIFSSKDVYAFDDLIGIVFKKSSMLEELRLEGIKANGHEDALSSFVQYIQANEQCISSAPKLDRIMLTASLEPSLDDTCKLMHYLQTNVPTLSVVLLTTEGGATFYGRDIPADLCNDPEWGTVNQGDAFGCAKPSSTRPRMIRRFSAY